MSLKPGRFFHDMNQGMWLKPKRKDAYENCSDRNYSYFNFLEEKTSFDLELSKR